MSGTCPCSPHTVQSVVSPPCSVRAVASLLNSARLTSKRATSYRIIIFQPSHLDVQNNLRLNNSHFNWISSNFTLYRNRCCSKSQAAVFISHTYWKAACIIPDFSKLKYNQNKLQLSRWKSMWWCYTPINRSSPIAKYLQDWDTWEK